MSLLSEAYEACTLLKRTVAPDGYGGVTEVWADDGVFEAAVTFDSSIEAKQAQAAGVSSLYTVTTCRCVTLKYHDVFRRDRDRKIFRVTSDGDDRFTPASASLDMRQVSAEEWRLPNG